MSLKNGFLSLLTPLAQAGTAAANTIATATVIDPTVLTAAFAVPLVGKGLEAICQKANEKWNQKSLIRTSLESLSTVLGELKEETADFPVDDRALLVMWQELTSHAASHDEWGKLLAATDLPTSTLLCGVIQAESPKEFFPVLEGALAAWLPLARLLRRNPAGPPPLQWPQPESLSCTEGFRAFLETELPRRWFAHLQRESLRESSQAIFRELSLELQRNMAQRLDQLHRHAFALPGLADPPTLERRLSGTLVELLRPQNPKGVPLVGREQDLELLQNWLDSPTPISIRCLIGRGGAGKTRLAVELLRALPNYWRAGFVEREDFESYLRQVRFRTCEWAQPTLLVFDYAAAYSGWLESLVKDLRDRDQSELLPLRVLLLERHASEKDGWFARLVGPNIEGAAKLFHPPRPVEIPSLQDLEQRRQLFKAALALCAEHEGSVPPVVPAAGENSDFDQHLAEMQFGDPLVLAMAAFRSNELRWAALNLSRAELAEQMAVHEVRRIAGFTSPEQPEPLLLHLASYATIAGGIAGPDLLRIIRSQGEAIGYSSAQPGALKDSLLGSILPGQNQIAGIEPDIIGEAFVLRQSRDQVRMIIFDLITSNPRGVVLFLIRLTQDFPQRLEVVGWLEELMEHGAARDLPLLIQMEAAIPQPCPLGIRPLALSLVEQMLAKLPLRNLQGDNPLRERARLLNSLAIRQLEAGSRKEALQTAQEVVELRKELVGRDQTAFLPDLAGALSNLAVLHSEAGMEEESLQTAEAAAKLFIELAGSNRAIFAPHLAMSLNNLANRQSETGRREEALRTAIEAEKLYLELVEHNREAFLPDLAKSQSNLATIQSENGNLTAAVETAEKALNIYMGLAGRNREAFLPDLAAVLNHLANRQHAVGEGEKALQTAETAIKLTRELVVRNSYAFQPDLAGSLNNLANMQGEAVKLEDSLRSAEEAWPSSQCSLTQ